MQRWLHLATGSILGEAHAPKGHLLKIYRMHVRGAQSQQALRHTERIADLTQLFLTLLASRNLSLIYTQRLTNDIGGG